MKKLLALAALAFAFSAYADPVKEGVALKDGMSASLVMNQTVIERWGPHSKYHFEIVHADGTREDLGTYPNTVTTQGKNDALDKYLKGSAYTASWYLIPKGSGSIVVGDTYASHSGWTEATAYSNATRPAVTWGTTSAGSNTATQVSYSINGTATIAGACLLYGSSTKSDATNDAAHILFSCTDFASARNVVSGDTLNVTPTVTD